MYCHLIFEVADIFYILVLLFLQLKLVMLVFHQLAYIQLLDLFQYLDFILFPKLFHFSTNLFQFQAYDLNKKYVE